MSAWTWRDTLPEDYTHSTPGYWKKEGDVWHQWIGGRWTLPGSSETPDAATTRGGRGDDAA